MCLRVQHTSAESTCFMAFWDLNSLALRAGSILCSKAGLSLCPRSVVSPAAPEDLPEGGVTVRPQLSVPLPRRWAEHGSLKSMGEQPYFSEVGLTVPGGWAPCSESPCLIPHFGYRCYCQGSSQGTISWPSLPVHGSGQACASPMPSPQGGQRHQTPQEQELGTSTTSPTSAGLCLTSAAPGSLS